MTSILYPRARSVGASLASYRMSDGTELNDDKSFTGEKEFSGRSDESKEFDSAKYHLRTGVCLLSLAVTTKIDWSCCPTYCLTPL